MPQPARRSRTQLLFLTVGMALIAAALPFAVHAQIANAQDVSGDWQATLEGAQAREAPGGKIRILMRIAKADAGLSVKLYNVDQPGPAVNTATTSFQSDTLKFSAPALNTTFEGKLNADGSSFTGTWAQTPGDAVPLVFVRATRETAWEIPAPPAPPTPMAADANPAFDVATIKPNLSGDPSKNLNINGRSFVTRNTSLMDMIGFVYGIHAKQLVGAPDWVAKDKFDIAAVPDTPGQPSEDQWKRMVKKLLADRFKLTFHHETKELSAYVLTVAKGTPKLTRDESTNPLPNLNFRPGTGGLTNAVRNARMIDFCEFLQILVLDRPVVDQTGLTGRYDFSYTFSPDDSLFGGRPPLQTPNDGSAPAPGFFTALEEQAGLKLVPARTPIDVLVIDRVEHPSEN